MNGKLTALYSILSPKDEARLKGLEDKYEIKELFEDISGTTTGTVTTYPGINISLDQWADQNNALAVEINAGRPTQTFLYTAAGELVEAVIDTAGNYTLSGTPTASDYCIIWQVRGSGKAFADAAIPENKIVLQYDLETPFVRSGADIIPIQPGDNLNLGFGGLKDDVRTDPLLVSEIEQKKASVVTVAKDGGDFTTIQAAIDSITDAAIDKIYVVLVSPGEYSEDIIGKDFVRVRGADPYVTVIKDGSYTCGEYFSGIHNVSFNNTITTDKTIIDATAGTGNPSSYVDFENVVFNVSTSTSGVNPTLIDIAMGVFILESFGVTYLNTSTGANSDHNLIKDTGAGQTTFTTGICLVQTAQLSGDLRFLGTDNAAFTTISNVFATIQAQNAAYSGEASAFYGFGTGQYEVIGCQYSLIGNGSGEGHAVKADSGSTTVTATSSTLTTQGFSVNCFGDAVQIGDVVNLSFCTILDDNVQCGLGVINKVVRQNGSFAVNTEIIDENLLLGDPANNSFQDIFNLGFGAGWVSGQGITDNGDGTVNISAGTGLVRTANDEQSQLKSFDIAAFTNVALVDNAENYLYVDYNGGAPTLLVTQSGQPILDNENDKYEIYEIYREGTSLHITPHLQRAKNVSAKVQQYLYSIMKISRANAEGGLILGTSGDGNRYVTVSAGKIWIKLNDIDVPAFDTNPGGGADTFDRYYRVASTFIKTTGNTQFSNTQYNDTTSGLVAIPLNRYSFQDFYQDADGDVVSIYATDNYTTQAAAESAPQPLTPARLEDHALYIGRVVVRQGVSTALNVLSPFTGLNLGTTPVTAHNLLSSLEWTASGHTGTVSTVAGFNGSGVATTYAQSGFVQTTGDQSIAGSKTFTGDLNYSSTNPVFQMIDSDSAGSLSIPFIETFDSALVRQGFFGWASSSDQNLYFNCDYGNIIFAAAVPTIKIQDLTNSGSASTPFLEFRDSLNARQGYCGPAFGIDQHVYLRSDFGSVIVENTAFLGDDVDVPGTITAAEVVAPIPARQTVTLSTGTTASLSHAGQVISYNNSTNTYIYAIPPNSSVAFPIGTIILFRKQGSGEISIIPQPLSSVAFQGLSGNSSIKIDGTGNDGNLVVLEKVGTDTWEYRGNYKL